MTFKAIEKPKLVRASIDVWKTKFREGANVFNAMGDDVFWHDRLGIWGLFFPQPIGANNNRYWNPFGRLPFRFRQNIIVEINPPASGINKSAQGIVAVDNKGHHWIMHRGRLNTRVVDGTTAMSTAEQKSFVPVTFSDSSMAECYPVADLEVEAKELKKRIADFVIICAKLRLSKEISEEIVDPEDALENIRHEFSPERSGKYKRPSLPEATVYRHHAEVWQAFADELDRRQIVYSNARVGRHGPDLRTFGTNPILFEIKSESSVADIQQAVDQLMIYENLLHENYKKVLVVPDVPGKAYALAIAALDIHTLLYAKKGKT